MDKPKEPVQKTVRTTEPPAPPPRFKDNPRMLPRVGSVKALAELFEGLSHFPPQKKKKKAHDLQTKQQGQERKQERLEEV